MSIWAAEFFGIRARRGTWFLLAATLLGLAIILPRLPARAETEPNFNAAVAPRSGDICITCNKPIGPSDKVYLLDGQRVAVHAGACELALRRNPEKYVAKLRPQGNQFMDADSGRSAHSWGWLIFGAYALAGLIFAGLCGYRAVNRGIPPLPWFFAGLFFNALAYLALLSRPRRPGVVTGLDAAASGMSKIPVTYSPRACPQCEAPNHPSAALCASCGAKIEPRVISEVTRVGMNR